MTDMSTPRERIEKFMEMFEGNVGMPTSSLVMKHRPTGEDMTLSFDDLRAVLSANAGYERIIAKQRREAVAEYKKTLAAELRHRIRGRAADTHPSALEAAGYDGALDDIADDLEDDSL